ncbi:1-acyl-sn-glycerol-3-phosphate acyltransferase [Aurantiacibacter atlanticus]|uniref:1-acyl-sn-glycerol-3-phosphate acyltransferase n=1 Tax=Aurantiacibacter atlanticus TaxID=1648404 RepID=A0A0H4VAI6_9SPHN|nr:lysophospholipid acyltransferase family protein [Aurantiacibacter atlanticus]AKQ41627.2 1-acyl-sn-glycerol-3-phosphate acyltransferase [Aurantiacibacter atlanticus]
MFVRNTIFRAAFALWTLLFAPLIPLLWVAGTPAALIRPLTRLWARGVLALSSLLGGIRYTVRGRANVPHGPVLIIANHQSAWETIAALVLFPDVAIVTKQELLATPVIGWFLSHSPMIPIDRTRSTSAMRKMLADCRREVAAGRSVLIFPEGTRRPPASVVEFKRGVELLYRSLQIPALVVAHNAGCLWHENMTLSPGVITVSILPPIASMSDPAGFIKDAQDALNKEVIALAPR